MGGFRQTRRGAAAVRPPAFVGTYPPTIFQESWKDRPREDVQIGLRIPADYEVSLARGNAARFAVETHPREEDLELRIACGNDALIRELCVLAMCRPDNAAEPYFYSPDLDVQQKLTTEGAKRLVDDLERHVLATSPVHRELGDEEIDELVLRLTPEAFALMTTTRAKRVRRLLAFVLDEIAAVDQLLAASEPT